VDPATLKSLSCSLGGFHKIKRYSDFFDLHTKLLAEFPVAAGEADAMAADRGGGRLLPYLPGKAMMGKANTKKTVQSSTALLSQCVGSYQSSYQSSYHPRSPPSYHRAADPLVDHRPCRSLSKSPELGCGVGLP